MKGQSLIPVLSVFLIAPLTAQETPEAPEPVAALQRASQTIEEADQAYNERESEILDLPDEPTFEVPQDEVYLDLPGSQTESTAMAVDAETISVDFPEEDVRDIIRSVAELYELNVVIPDSLAGSVSIKLRDVTWQQVFEVVLEPLNYTYVVDGNIIKIKSQEDLAVEPVDTRVFIIDFAKAEDLRASVAPLIGTEAGGKIQVDVRSNALVITERPSRMNDIQEIIETLDRPTEQVMIESKFIEVSGREDTSVGVDWQSLIGYRVQAGPMTRTYDRVDSRIDNPVVAGEDTLNVTNTNGQTTTTIVQESQNLPLTEWLDSVSRTDEAIFSADAFSVVLSALETNTDIKLVSNPTIVTMNNKKATIHIGEEYPIPNYTYNEERGTFEVSNFEYKPIGINLDVIPQINSAGFINLDIRPEISTRTGEVQFGGASGAEIPIITSRKTNSSVTIKSGFTLAIGGLIEQRDENRSSKVPVLGSIPLLGNMFKSDGKQVDQRNLIVFITAKILSASGATYRDVFSQRTLYDMGVKSSDVPGYEPPPEEKELFDNIQESRDTIQNIETEMKLRQELRALETIQTGNAENLEKRESDPDGYREIPRRYK